MRWNKLSRIYVGANSVRLCSEIMQFQHCMGAAQFLLCRNPTSRPLDSLYPPAWLVEKIQTSLLRAGCRISVSLRTEISPSPYKRDRIVFLFCPTMVVIVDLFLRRANAVRPYRFVAVILWFCTIFIQFSSFKQGAGSAFLCDQNLSSCSPNSR